MHIQIVLNLVYGKMDQTDAICGQQQQADLIKHGISTFISQPKTLDLTHLDLNKQLLTQQLMLDHAAVTITQQITLEIIQQIRRKNVSNLASMIQNA
jgi:hypothetical protein